MKHTLLLAALAGALSAGAAEAMPYRIDPAQTRIGFSIGAKGYPLTRGEFHRFSSSLAIDPEMPGRSMVSFRVAAASIDTHAALLDEYVRGAGFLDAARHPDIAFASTTVRRIDDHSVEVAGNLSMLGVVHPEVFRVTVQQKGEAPNAEYLFVAEGQIHRSDFGMTGGLPLVSDDVTITVTASARAQ